LRTSEFELGDDMGDSDGGRHRACSLAGG
jgi:hypothetical protein